MIAALLLGRKGSVGFPGKNTLPILGRPMCAYPLIAAQEAQGIDQVFVSTDDEEIMDITTTRSEIPAHSETTIAGLNNIFSCLMMIAPEIL